MIEGWIVMPAFNEAQGMAAQLGRLATFLSRHGAEQGVAYTVLVVNDGSSDGTEAQIEASRGAVEAQGVGLRVVMFVRNFGHQAAVVAGLMQAATSASFAITLDADGEHPHALVPELVAAWRAGAPIVHTLRRPHAQLGAAKRLASAAYYKLLSRVSGVRIRPGMADFKLWDGALLRELSSFLPQCGSTRVFAAWIAPFAPVIEYDQAVVEGRSSRFTFRKNVSLALGGLVRYTDAPLRLALWMSLFAGAVAAGHSLFVVWAVYTGQVVPGWATIVIIVALFGALQSFSIGVLGEYLLRITFRSSLPIFVTRRALPPAVAARADATERPAPSAEPLEAGYPGEVRRADGAR